MKTKTIKKAIIGKMNKWWASIEDEAVRKIATENTIVTGGCIASMLLREDVNDFDVYLRTKEAVVALANYYVAKFSKQIGRTFGIDVQEDRVRITTPNKYRGDTAGVVPKDESQIEDPGSIEDAHEDTKEAAKGAEETPIFTTVFLSTNAISLRGKVQIVLRFYGEPEEIHKNYDFIHCTNYWTSWDKNLVLNQPALESILTKELRYVGSKYPVCSLFRLRKFIQRQWTVNAGQILKIAMQVSALDLTVIKVLEDQLTGVDVAFFIDLVDKIKEKDPEKVNSAYLVEIVDQLF